MINSLRDKQLNLHIFLCCCSHSVAPSGKSSKLPVVPKLDTTIRAKRLMKEFKELQKQLSGVEDGKMFEVSEKMREGRMFGYHITEDRLLNIYHDNSRV